MSATLTTGEKMGSDSRRRSAGLLLVALLALCGGTLATLPAVAASLAMPANIQAIMKKLSSGGEVTPADEKALNDFATSMRSGQSGKAAADQPKPGGVYAFSVGDDDDGDAEKSPCASPGKAVGLGQTPSRADYLAMVDKVLHSSGDRLGSKPRDDGLSATLTQVAQPSAGSDLAPLLMVVGQTDAAVLSAAEAAKRAPDDALSANNLGAMLKGAGDFADAAIALQYAASLTPESTLVATNLGWLALAQGDSKAAGGFFTAAVGQSPEMAPALTGQGMVAACAGRPAEALPLFRAALKIAYTDVAANGIKHVEQVIEDGTKKGTAPDIGTPDAYGPKGGPTNSTSTPLWPKMLIADTAATAAAYGDRNAYQFYNDWELQMGAESEPARRALIPPDAERGTTFDGRRFVFTRGYDKEWFVVGDIEKMFDIQSRKILDDLDAKTEALVQKNGCFSCAGPSIERPESCNAYRAKAIANYADYLPVARRDWDELQEALADLYGYSAPWIARIHDPATAGHAWVDLDDDMETSVTLFAGNLRAAALEIYLSWNVHDDCDDPNGAPPKAQTVKPYKDDATKCRTPPIVMPTPIAGMNANCDQITLYIGYEGVAASLQYKFSPDYTFENGEYVNTSGNDGSWTVFAGIAPATGIDAPMNLSPKIGPTVTFQGGHVTDIGGELGVSEGMNPIGWTGRVGVVSGATSTVTDSTSTNWGGQ
jgi:tetratricopeptide (TPR) repeat protein